MKGQWSDISQYIILSCILMFGLGALIFHIIKLCQTKCGNICGQNDVENATKNGNGGLVEEWLYKKLHSKPNLKFLFLSLFDYPLKNCSSQFFSNWDLA